MSDTFHACLYKIFKKRTFLQFDYFIIREMGVVESEDITKEIRQQAFRIFREKTNKEEFVSLPTMRKWFGLNGFSKPTREKVFEICFALGADAQKTEEYLTKGLAEPSFQINDYQEIIFLYGLENQLTFQECIQMATVFEQNMDQDISFQNTHTTHELYRQYRMSRKLGKAEFIMWMSDRADWFKGYSKTTLDYLGRYRTAILTYLRETAKIELKELLMDTSYFKWAQKSKKKDKSPYEMIKSFVKSHRESYRYRVSESMEKNIMELDRLAFSKKEANAQVLAEVFSTLDNREGIQKSQNIRKMTGKYLSDLFHIPDQKERAIRTSQALRFLRGLPEHADCPEWIRSMGEEYTKGKGDFSTAKQAFETLNEFSKEHKRRCLLVQRSDLLPLVLHVSEQQYIMEHDGEYEAAAAREHFENLANATLNACNMATLSDEYELDVALMACFQPEEMFTYSDVLDAINGRE